VVQRAAEARLTAIALTDHDTLDGLPEAVEAGTRLGLRVIPGCEFSVAAPWGEVHVLGYFLPLDSNVIQEFLADLRLGRHRRASLMVAKLQGLGVDIEMEDVLAVADGAALGRPHVARALVQRGTVNDIGMAFDQYLGWGRPANQPKRLPGLREVADIVHRAGGLLSAAHMKDRASQKNLAKLQAAGLDAVEVLHPRHARETGHRIERHAEALGLLKTGGSDWHGDSVAGLQHASIGSQRVPAEWLDRLEAARPTDGPASET